MFKKLCKLFRKYNCNSKFFCFHRGGYLESQKMLKDDIRKFLNNDEFFNALEEFARHHDHVSFDMDNCSSNKCEDKMTWIKCSERLPEEGERLLVVLPDCDYNKIEIAYLNGNCWYSDCSAADVRYTYYAHQIKYWMPLPELPKDLYERSD